MSGSLPTLYQDFIHLSRYARWIAEEGRRETWTETVDRYIDFMCKRCKVSARVRKELRQAILNLEVMPSMRALMTAGPALERDAAAGYNCFHGAEKYLTRNGLKTFAETSGTVQKVLDGVGQWSDAEIKSFGVQKLQLVTLKPCAAGHPNAKTNVRHTVRVTPDHRWITERGEVTDLQVGDRVPFCQQSIPLDSSRQNEAWIRGFGYGDGTIDARGRAKVRLCGDKDMKNLHRFEEYGHCAVMCPPSYGGDAVVLFSGKRFSNWKELPYDEVEDPGYISSWLEGYLAADGHNDPHQPGLSSQCDEAIRFVMEIAPYAGYLVTGHNVSSVMETNLGARSAPLQRLTLRTEGFFRVQSIEELDEDEVFCAVEPKTHSFTLANGVLTGNCSYLAIDRITAFDEMLYILMCGAGVGFSVERQFIANLPVVAGTLRESKTTIKVEDSKLGWANAYREMVSMLYQGRIPTWDVSEVRPAGARLMTFGGRASGPEPLEDLFRFSISMFKEAAGRKLTSIECHDLCCKIGEVVVVGGVRRSALISLSNPSDDRMRHAKSGNWRELTPWRQLSNNSACYTEKPDMDVFMREWLSLYESKSGERGFFNREAATKQVAKYGRREPDFPWGCNPCSEIILRSAQFCVGPDTPLVTASAIHPRIADLEGKEVDIWNGEEWTPVTVRKTGEGQKLVRVHISDGSYLDCTPDHRWSVKDRFKDEWCEVQAKDLMSFSKYAVQVEPANTVPSGAPGVKMTNPYTFGFAVGDGCVYGGAVLIDLHGPKDWDCPISGTRQKPQLNYTGTSTYVRSVAEVDIGGVAAYKATADAWYQLGGWNRESFLWFVAGLADADGSETGTGGIRIYIGEKEKGRALQLALAKNGIRCSLNLHQEEGVETNLCVRQTDSWYVQITECQEIPCHRLDTSGGHEPKFKGKYQVIRAVEELDGVHDTYCFTEPKKHKAMFGNILTYQCNLTEVIIRAGDCYSTMARKVRLATILGTMQSTLTDFRYLRDEWKKNTEEERLLGVSLTGVMDHELMSGAKGNGDLAETLKKLRLLAVKTNKEWAKRLGINPSTAITCNKPSGTVSQLGDCASGIHARHSEYYIRNVRADKKDPMAQFMVSIGFPYEDDVMKPEHNWVFPFPVKAPDGAITDKDTTALTQLELWKTYQDFWCEHKPSCTVTVREHEWMGVGAWVYDHFDQVSGIAFLPASGGHIYKQTPYQACSKKEYEEALKKMPKEVDWAGLAKFEEDDSSINYGELACSAGSCELVDLVSSDG